MLQPKSSELTEVCDFAVDLVKRAGSLVLSHFRYVTIEWKVDGSEVTEADRRAEQLIRTALEKAHPSATILGEEFGGEKAPVAGDQWVIDPIDGTTPFTLGHPMFGTLIALLRDGDPIVGVIHMPALGETLFAAKGHGCHWQLHEEAPQIARVDSVGALEKAFVSSAGVHCSEVQPVPGAPHYQLGALIAACRKFRVVGDCYQHLLICRGRLHLALDPIMAPWDNAALIPCIREAGGVVTDLRGETDNPVFAGSIVTACDQTVLESALTVMNIR